MPGEKPPALRVVHLFGGLRAVDLAQDRVHLEVSPDYRFGYFPTPAYTELYENLQTLGFQIIGVEFITNHSFAELAPPEWEVAYRGRGFLALAAGRAWSEVRSASIRDGEPLTYRIASRVQTYIRLVNFRVFELSRAFNSCLNMAVRQRDPVEVDHGFGNMWIEQIDAAIHGFLSDAAAFRDVLAEAIWRLVLRSNIDSVHTLSALLKRSKASDHPLADAVVSAAQSGGWLHQLMELRNAVVHVAPIANSQEHHFALIKALQRDFPIKYLHIPLLTKEGEVRRPDTHFVDYQNHDLTIGSLRSYMDYAQTSQDALSVCHRLCSQLIDLSEAVREHAGLKRHQVTITDADIVGPIVSY